MKLLFNKRANFEITNLPDYLSVLSRITRLSDITISSDLRICEYILDHICGAELFGYMYTDVYE